MNKKFINQHLLFIVLVLVSVLSTFLAAKKCSNSLDGNKIIEKEIEYVDSNKTYNKIHMDAEFSKLKKENKELYDSLKKSRDIIDYLIQFDYEKSYSSGKVETSSKNDNASVSISHDYVYESEPNDSFEYKLTINSEKEPNYYQLDTKIKQRFTIANEHDKGMNHTTIKEDGKGDISNVTVFHNKEKKKFIDRFAVGPSITVGYDPLNKNMGCMVGVSLTFNILK